MDRLFEWVFLAGYAFYMLVLIIPSEMQSRRTTVREKRDNSGGKVLSVLAALGLYIIPIIDVLNPEARIVDMEVPPAAWLVSGIAGTLIFGFALWLWTLAQLLLLQNWITGLSGLICFLPLYLYRVPREEQMMIDTFGEEYLDYMSKTPRLLPRIWPQSWREKSG
jgi:hypothetical protein